MIDLINGFVMKYMGVIFFLCFGGLYILYMYVCSLEFTRKAKRYGIELDFNTLSFVSDSKLEIGMALVLIGIISYIIDFIK